MAGLLKKLCCVFSGCLSSRSFYGRYSIERMSIHPQLFSSLQIWSQPCYSLLVIYPQQPQWSVYLPWLYSDASCWMVASAYCLVGYTENTVCVIPWLRMVDAILYQSWFGFCLYKFQSVWLISRCTLGISYPCLHTVSSFFHIPPFTTTGGVVLSLHDWQWRGIPRCEKLWRWASHPAM